MVLMSCVCMCVRVCVCARVRVFLLLYHGRYAKFCGELWGRSKALDGIKHVKVADATTKVKKLQEFSVTFRDVASSTVKRRRKHQEQKQNQQNQQQQQQQQQQQPATPTTTTTYAAAAEKEADGNSTRVLSPKERSWEERTQGLEQFQVQQSNITTAAEYYAARDSSI